LLGKYDDHDQSPLGRKAVISAIWEIEQENFPDGLALNELPKTFITNELEIVGLIYTDLLMKDGLIYSYKRTRDYIISTLELNLFYEVFKKYNNKSFINICIRS